MKINRWVGIGILVSGVLLLAGILLRDFLLVNFVQPMALMLWVGRRVIISIDQSVYWAGLILAVTFITLLRLSKQQTIHETEHPHSGNATLNNMGHWRTLILLTSDETDQLNFLKHSMRTLLKDIYASKSPSLVPWKIYQGVEEGDISVPESIRNFLMLDPVPKPPPNLIERLRRFIQSPFGWGRRWTRQYQADYYRNIAESISFMENELENEDD